LLFIADTWEYVTMWLKRHQQENASFYWEHASSFFHASRDLMSKNGWIVDGTGVLGFPGDGAVAAGV
jgi:hypothetical protein